MPKAAMLPHQRYNLSTLCRYLITLWYNVLLSLCDSVLITMATSLDAIKERIQNSLGSVSALRNCLCNCVDVNGIDRTGRIMYIFVCYFHHLNTLQATYIIYYLLLYYILCLCFGIPVFFCQICL